MNSIELFTNIFTFKTRILTHFYLSTKISTLKTQILTFKQKCWQKKQTFSIVIQFNLNSYLWSSYQSELDKSSWQITQVFPATSNNRISSKKGNLERWTGNALINHFHSFISSISSDEYIINNCVVMLL